MDRDSTLNPAPGILAAQWRGKIELASRRMDEGLAKVLLRRGGPLWSAPEWWIVAWSVGFNFTKIAPN